SPSITWIGYLSTIGVYGDADGGWVDEETEARPGSERGQRRLDAENAWLALGQRTGKASMVFRLPGIYGPGRSTIDDLRAGEARRLIKPGQVFNRIHVVDIATALTAAIDKPHAGRVYNVTDDEPGPPQDVVAYGAELLGLPVPPGLDFATADLTPMARSFYSESKRVSNARMKSELGVALKYPNYRDGLRDILQSSG
nr:SDR family NAD(P)-dependent oxidoreductase [Hyphomicrobium sp.]